MTHTTDKNYKKKHVFEPSGTYSEIGKELCECGLPLDIPTMHYEKSSTDTQKETWQERFDKSFPEVQEIGSHKCEGWNDSDSLEEGQMYFDWKPVKDFFQKELDTALRERTDKVIKDFGIEVENNTLISEMYGWKGILEMSLDRVKSKYLQEKEKENV